MSESHAFDAITADALRARGGLKWAHDPASLPAWIAEMDFGTAPSVLAALHDGVDAMSFGYLDPTMTGRMAQACASWMRAQYTWDVPVEHIHPVADVLKALEVTLQSFSPPGSPLIVPTPSYMPFLTVPPSIGRDVVQVPGQPAADGRWALDLAAIDEALARVGRGVLVVCNPWNPVGTVLTRAELLAVSEVVERHPGVRVFADEIHSPLVFPGQRHVPYASISAAAAEHSVTATSASKAWNLAGLKTAQLILTSEADLEVWPSIAFLATHGASNLGVLAAAAAFSTGQPWLDGVMDYLDGNRALLGELVAAELPGVRYRPPDGTYLAWLDCRALELPTAPADYFRAAVGVALVDGAACGDAGDGCVRLNFGTTRPILREVVARMGAAVRDVQASAAAAPIHWMDRSRPVGEHSA